MLSSFNKVLKLHFTQLLHSIAEKPKQLGTHINAVFYRTPTIRLLPLSEVYQEIIGEWKENPLLGTLLPVWCGCLETHLPTWSPLSTAAA
jgi:hypothetical protein